MFGSFLLITLSLIFGRYSTNVFSNNENKYFINNGNFSLPSTHKYGKNDFEVGAILPYTGALSSMGKSVKVALEKAEYDVNKHFQGMHPLLHFNLLMADSKTSPEESLIAIKKLHENGANIILGPATSTAVSAVKGYADANNITLISYASTSPLLSIEGDSLFRLVPDDTFQGKKIAEKMISDGIKAIVPFWESDIYGNELYNSTIPFSISYQTSLR